MTSLIAKYRSVPRYVVAVFLAAVSCFSLRADVSCGPVGDPFRGTDGKWYVTVVCYGDIYSSTDVEVQAPSSSGSCTNCTAMTPEECEQLRTDLLNKCDHIDSRFSSALSELISAEGELISLQNNLMSLQAEGQQFAYYPSRSDLVGSESFAGSTWHKAISQEPTFPYLAPQEGTTSAIQNQQLGGNNGIYNYYNQSVGPAIQEVIDNNIYNLSDKLNEAKVQLVSGQTDVISVRCFVNDMNCSVCEGSGGGGGGGSSDPSTPSTGCPCAEVLNAIKSILEEIRTKVNSIEAKVSSWDPIIKQFRGYADYMKSAISTLSFMGTNFVYATEYKRDFTSFTMEQLHHELWANTNFDFSVFGQYNWFSRIEYLLLSLNGVFGTDSLDQSKQQRVLDKTQRLEDSAETEKGELDTNLSRLEQQNPVAIFYDKVKTILRLFKDSFGVSQPPEWSQMALIEGNMETFGLDLDGTMKVYAFGGVASEATVSFMNFLRRFCQVVYYAFGVYLLWLVYCLAWRYVSVFIRWIIRLYPSIFG